jgi:hypothetical protein
VFLLFCCSSLRLGHTRQDNSLTSDRQWTLNDALPGEPDLDYPILATVPDTDFSCDDKGYGKREIYTLNIVVSALFARFFCCMISGLRFFFRHVSQAAIDANQEITLVGMLCSEITVEISLE